jgi:hypothetical protein|nr:MAG TPA: hypothetical protein [Caudoviricetes sp.]
MKIDKGRTLCGESLPLIADYVADELNLRDSAILVKSIGIKDPIPYEYTFVVGTAIVSMYFKTKEYYRLHLVVKTPGGLEFPCDTFGEVIENIHRLAVSEEEEVG